MFKSFNQVLFGPCKFSEIDKTFVPVLSGKLFRQ
jgi:hypothetical protein